MKVIRVYDCFSCPYLKTTEVNKPNYTLSCTHDKFIVPNLLHRLDTSSTKSFKEYDDKLSAIPKWCPLINVEVLLEDYK